MALEYPRAWSLLTAITDDNAPDAIPSHIMDRDIVTRLSETVRVNTNNPSSRHREYLDHQMVDNEFHSHQNRDQMNNHME
jgi:hypothetical protein